MLKFKNTKITILIFFFFTNLKLRLIESLKNYLKKLSQMTYIMFYIFLVYFMLLLSRGPIKYKGIDGL